MEDFWRRREGGDLIDLIFSITLVKEVTFAYNLHPTSYKDKFSMQHDNNSIAAFHTTVDMYTNLLYVHY